MINRIATITRKTNETAIELTFNLDGTGIAQINTGIAFFDHMLTLFTVHGLFDLTIKAKGDLEVDYHHTVEDIGICLGEAFRQAIASAKGITRYASGLIPMDEALCQIAVDISNRPFLNFAANPGLAEKVGTFDLELLKEFLVAFVNNARITLHCKVIEGENMHHIVESCFKALGIILDRSTQIDSRKNNIPSTKGVL